MGSWVPRGTGLQLIQFNKPASTKEMKTKNMTTLHLRNSIGRSPLPRRSFSEGGSLLTILRLRHAFLLIPLVLAWFALSQSARAQLSPAPDGGYPGNNTAEGDDALFSLTIGAGNTANGFNALFSNTKGSVNTATGFSALYSNTIGYHNTANGYYALYSNTTSNSNTAEGYQALQNNTGSDNTGLGVNAGLNLTTGSQNIDIGNSGVAGESNTMRIGRAGNQTRAFIAGIRGVNTANANAVPVVIDSAGQLGTMSSSKRFKKEIKPMDQTSEAILGLKPVTFHYKSDSTGTRQFGLIAEEVAKVNPDLVVRDENGEIYSVRYEAVNAMLLNEFLKEHRKNEEQEATIARQEATITQLKQDFQSRLVEQEKQINALTACLQKVSAQLEMSKPAPQTVLNNQ